MSSFVRRTQIKMFRRRGVEKVVAPGLKGPLITIGSDGAPIYGPVMKWPQFAPKTVA